MFVNGDGKLSSYKSVAHQKIIGEESFVLVLSSSKLWKDYCGKIEAAVPENIFQLMTRINKDSWESPNTALDVFDSLIWVNPAYVVDVDIDTWYKMLEFYSETDLQLKGTSRSNLETSNPINLILIKLMKVCLNLSKRK